MQSTSSSPYSFFSATVIQNGTRQTRYRYVPSEPRRANDQTHPRSTKNGYSRLKRGRHVVATFQSIMPPCAKSWSASRQKKLRGVNLTMPRRALLLMRGSKGWCSYRGSKVRPVAHFALYSGAVYEPSLSTAAYYYDSFFRRFIPVFSVQVRRSITSIT